MQIPASYCKIEELPSALSVSVQVSPSYARTATVDE